VAERKAMIDRSHALPLARQAEALGISRSSLYYQYQPQARAKSRKGNNRIPQSKTAKPPSQGGDLP
jgi:hypothetical protein